MRVLAIQPFLRGYSICPFAGGKNKAALRLAQYLVLHGHEVFVLPWYEQTLETTYFYLTDNKLYATAVPSFRLLDQPNTPIALLRRVWFWLKLWYQRKDVVEVYREQALRHAVDTIQPDIVHVHHTVSDFPRVYRELGYRIPLLLTHTHGTGKYLSYFDGIVFFSRYVQERVCLEKSAEVKRSWVIAAGVDREYFASPAPGLASEIVFLGALKDERKGLDILLDAYGAEQGLNRWRLTVVGDGPLRAKYEQVAAFRSLNVRFVGRLPNEDVARLMSESSLFVLPSREESFGIAYAEALCMGLPIIGHPPAIKELGEEVGLEVGFPFDAATAEPSQLAKLIKHAMSGESGFDLAHRSQLLKRAREVFSWESFGLEYVQCYEETMAAVRSNQEHV